jgi:predicted O-methyltransferase YrrM
MGWWDIYGHFDFEDIYTQAVEECPQDGIIVEIGVQFGRSLMYLAHKAIQEKRPDIRIVGVDPWIVDRNRNINVEGWGGPEFSRQRKFIDPMAYAVNEMTAHAPSEYARVELMRLTSVEASEKFEQNGVHMVFIDGDHRYEQVKRDIEVWLPKIRSGGVLAGHDYGGYETVRRAVREAFSTYTCRKCSWWVRR